MQTNRAALSKKLKVGAVALAALAVLAGCGDNGDDTDTAEGTETTAAADTTAASDTTAADDPAASDDVEPLEEVFGSDDLDVVADYVVEGDQLVGDAPAEELEPFERFNELFPADIHPEITRYVAIRTPPEGGLDGILDRNKLHPEQFVLALDISGADSPEELDRTMIHEFAHLVSLRPSQIPVEPETVEGCEIFAIEGAGCPAEGSYLYAFETEFWPTYTLAERDAEEADANLERFDEATYVTDYAATNPVEDFAESFADWVVKQDRPQGDEVVDEKVSFFEDYPELIELRDNVREAL
ncbi:MAG: hypothetical protein KDB24_16965 [Microthrixaceae bacterium]|nr:hypothetical protein [Microthrixaceae bacterium]